MAGSSPTYYYEYCPSDCTVAGGDGEPSPPYLVEGLQHYRHCLPWSRASHRCARCGTTFRLLFFRREGSRRGVTTCMGCIEGRVWNRV